MKKFNLVKHLKAKSRATNKLRHGFFIPSKRKIKLEKACKKADTMCD